MNNKSYYIKEIEEKIKTGQFNTQKFWSSIKPPLYEYINDEHLLVTFIVKGEMGKTYVLLSALAGFDLKENIFHHLIDDIYYLSIKAPKEFISTYRIAEDIPLNFDEYYEKRDEFLDNVYPDPLNPEQYIWPENTDYEDEGAVMSIVKNKVDVIQYREDVPKGEVERLRFKSSLLNNERNIRVYKPHGYNENKKYPLLLFTDGFAYTQVTKTPLILDDLIESKQIKPVVAVFVSSPYRGARDIELPCNEEFRAMIAEELLPWMKEKYSVTDKSEETAICGASFGGLFASYLVLKYSHLFGNVLSQSGAYWFRDEVLLKQYQKADKLPVKLYLNVGKLEDDQMMLRPNHHLFDVLHKKGYTCQFELFPGGHDHLSWGNTLSRGLKFLFGY